MSKFDGLERDANAAIKALMCEIEEASAQEPEEATHPYVLKERRQRVVKRIWALIKRCMNEVEHAEMRGYGNSRGLQRK